MLRNRVSVICGHLDMPGFKIQLVGVLRCGALSRRSARSTWARDGDRGPFFLVQTSKGKIPMSTTSDLITISLDRATVHLADQWAARHYHQLGISRRQSIRALVRAGLAASNKATPAAAPAAEQTVTP
jgi:hypothetical protein